MSSTPVTARSRRTRDALLDATRAILQDEGAAAVTMAAVADRAGVTRRAVYLHFATRAELIAALGEHVARTEGLQRSLDRVWGAPTAVAALDEWAAHLVRYHARVLPVDRAIAQVYRSDPDAAAHRSRVFAAKLANCRRLAQWLADDEVLADGWTVGEAADMLYALTTSDVVESLLVERHWSGRKLSERMGGLLRSTLSS